jgi:hypothetical protein
MSVSCAEPAPQAPAARALPRYDAAAADLFDDAIEPAAVGIPLEARADPKGLHLRALTVAADAVVRARAITLTSRHEEGAPSWQLGLHTLETLAGSAPPETFTLQIKGTDPSAGIVRSTEGQIAGKTFVAFLREFSDDDRSHGDAAQLHFHVAPDSKDEVDAVRQAALLGEVR